MRFPFLRSKSASAEERTAAAADAGPVQLARIHARRRLVGALVLLVAGIAVFPVLFETQPRPVAVDTPIVMPAGDTPRVVRGALAPAPMNVPPSDAGVEGPVGSPASAATAAPLPVALPPAAAASLAGAKPTVAAGKPASVAMGQDEGARALALLEARTAASEPKAGPPRFVVQAGAYSEAGALRDARQKVEKLGLKTYTQVIEGDSGKRTRVRVGPFAARQEAEAVAAKIRAAGLQASILAL